ncbi:MAG TPA: aminotransferase class IV, partial [Deltaproteobacteria bacterium]|nr:aminotransferase class IV [Deltaproteobacteria bacterium]
ARRPVDRHDPFLYHKTTRRRVYEEALAEAASYDDVVLYNHGGYVTESTRANVVARIDGGLVTPPVDCGLLPGTFRQWMLENSLARERPITVQELLEAERVFLVNSVRGMYPVVVDGHGA